MTLPCDAYLKLGSTGVFFFACALLRSTQTNTWTLTLSLSLRRSLLFSWPRLPTLEFHRCAHTGHPQKHTLSRALTLSSASTALMTIGWVNSCSGSTRRLVCRTWLCAEVDARPITAQRSFIIHVYAVCVGVHTCTCTNCEWAWVCVRYLWLHGLNFC